MFYALCVSVFIVPLGTRALASISVALPFGLVSCESLLYPDAETALRRLLIVGATICTRKMTGVSSRSLYYAPVARSAYGEHNDRSQTQNDSREATTQRAKNRDWRSYFPCPIFRNSNTVFLQSSIKGIVFIFSVLDFRNSTTVFLQSSVKRIVFIFSDYAYKESGLQRTSCSILETLLRSFCSLA